MPVAYLEKLNPEQRRAVEHGVRENDAAPGTPLLVIAGAGSGKRIANSARVSEIARQEADRGDPLARGLDQPQLRLPNKIISPSRLSFQRAKATVASGRGSAEAVSQVECNRKGRKHGRACYETAPDDRHGGV
jgi:hypothetical protein